ncbi:MAG: FRG domain-containing protein [Candidatus Lernaella stagnicola]|nr:FRG domain-containing protein [Candidatus Lernaella stagnicola]
MTEDNEKQCFREKHFGKNVEDFLKFLLPSREEWRGNNKNIPEPEKWLFRGQGLDVPPVPSALRRNSYGKLIYFCLERAAAYLEKTRKRPLDKEEKFSDEAFHVGAEYDFLRDFLKAADWQGRQLIGYTMEFRDSFLKPEKRDEFMKRPVKWPSDNLLELLALAQHYGVPTRLLDWSERAHIAAYFAASSVVNSWDQKENEKIKVVIWALKWRDLGYPIKVIRPTMGTNPNLAAQRGVLTLFRENDFFKKLLKRKCNSNKDKGNVVLWKITLDKGVAGELLRDLYDIGIHAGSIYPTFDGAAKFVMERRFWPDHDEN